MLLTSPLISRIMIFCKLYGLFYEYYWCMGFRMFLHYRIIRYLCKWLLEVISHVKVALVSQYEIYKFMKKMTTFKIFRKLWKERCFLRLVHRFWNNIIIWCLNYFIVVDNYGIKEMKSNVWYGLYDLKILVWRYQCRNCYLESEWVFRKLHVLKK